MSQGDRFEIEGVHWVWREEHVECSAGNLVGGNLPSRFRTSIKTQLRWDFPPSSQVWRLGCQLATYLMDRLQPLDPIDVGADAPLTGEFDGPPVCCPAADCTTDVTRWFSYANGYRERVTHRVADDDMPEPFRLIKREIHRVCKERLMALLFEKLVPPNFQADPKRWHGVKTEVFISYRGSREEEATELFHMLGEYGERGVFLPRMDKVDMQVGNWMDQLMQMIDKCDVFMPLLTKDYLDGPISRPELDQALRAHFQKRSKRIVPLLLEGGFGDYENHFLGGLHIVDVRHGLDEVKFEEIANLCLGVTRNPYE